MAGALGYQALLLVLRLRLHAKDRLARFHQIQFIAREELGISRIIPQKIQFLTLFIVLGALHLDLLLESLERLLLSLLFFDQRQEPADQQNHCC